MVDVWIGRQSINWHDPGSVQGLVHDEWQAMYELTELWQNQKKHRTWHATFFHLFPSIFFVMFKYPLMRRWVKFSSSMDNAALSYIRVSWLLSTHEELTSLMIGIITEAGYLVSIYAEGYMANLSKIHINDQPFCTNPANP
jgi:NADH:ubiquinone oxidoreductase subunit 5 (subunit L)/multisubunit Na+/H+ antiporter MnhA subunit